MFRVFLDGLTNEITSKILADSIAITQTFCDEQFSLCQVAASQLKLTTIEDLSLTNHKLYITTENTSECVCTYTVTYSAKVQNSSNVNITAYDKLKSIDKDVSAFYNGASIQTVESMFNSFCTIFNLGLVANDKCANRTVQLDRTISPTKLNGLEFFGKLCEIMGVWVYQKGDSLVIENFTSSLGETITQTYGAHGYSKKDYITWDIHRVKIKTEDDDVGVTVGSGGSCYTVSANYLIYGNDNLETIANGILDNIRGLQYRPCELEIPFSYAKAGAIKFNYGNDFILAMSKEIGKTIKITCRGTAYLEEPESTANEMAIIKGQSNVIKNDVNGLQQRVTHIEEDYTTSADLIVAAGQIEASVITSIGDDFVHTNNEEDIQKITWKMTTDDGVTINSHNVATPFQVQADGTTVLKVDSNGLTVNGSGTFTGTVSAGTVTGGTVTGASISGGTVSGASISGGTITGSNIYINNGGIYATHGDSGSEVTNKIMGAMGDGTDAEVYIGGINETNCIPHLYLNASISTEVTGDLQIDGGLNVDEESRFWQKLEVKDDLSVDNDLSVTGTISEGGTSLVDKYAPLNTTDHIEESELEQGHWWDGGGYQDTGRKRLKSTTRFKGKTRYTFTNYSNVVSFILGYAYIAEHTDTVVDLPTNSSIEVYFDNDFTMYSNNGTESEIINAYTTMRIATTEIQAQLDRNGFGEECGGRNLFRGYDVMQEYIVLSGDDRYNGNYTIGGLANFYGAYQSDLVLTQGKTYTVSAMVWNASGTICLYSSDSSFSASQNWGERNIASRVWTKLTWTFTCSSYDHFLRIEAYNNGETRISQFMVEEGSTCHDYEPFILSNRQLSEIGETTYFGLDNKSTCREYGCLVCLTLLDCRPSQIKAKLRELGIKSVFYCGAMNSSAIYPYMAMVSANAVYSIPLSPPYPELDDTYYLYGTIVAFKG